MKKQIQKIFSPIIVAWGRTPVVWLWRKPKTSLELLRQVESKFYKPGWRSRRQRLLSRILYFPMLLVWPFRAVLIAVSQFRSHAANTRKLYGVPYSVQIYSLLAIGLRYWKSPQIYYLFEIYRNRDLADARMFLLENSMTALMEHINTGKNDDHIQDKHAFNRAMGARGFPVIEDVGLVKQGSIVDVNGNPLELPACDLIAKPDFGLEGRGLTRFQWMGSDQYNDPDGKTFTRKELEEHLLKLAQEEVYLLQRRMTNHPAIQDLATGQFCTCRIITGMTPEGVVEVIMACFKMPLSHSVADNFGAGGIASGVDLDTGELGSAVYKYRFFHEFDEHPDTGATITGRKLPCWQATLDLVRSAHRQVDGGFAFLGWDVGITESGPVIVETQVTFGFILCQRPGRVAIGASRFPEIYSRWIDAETLGVKSTTDEQGNRQNIQDK